MKHHSLFALVLIVGLSAALLPTSASAQVAPVGIAKPYRGGDRIYAVMSNGDVYAGSASGTGGVWTLTCNLLADGARPDERVVGVAGTNSYGMYWADLLFGMTSTGRIVALPGGCGGLSQTIFEMTGRPAEEVVAFGTDAMHRGYALTAGGNVFSVYLGFNNDIVYEGNIFNGTATTAAHTSFGQLKAKYAPVPQGK